MPTLTIKCYLRTFLLFVCCKIKEDWQIVKFLRYPGGTETDRKADRLTSILSRTEFGEISRFMHKMSKSHTQSPKI